MKFFFYSNHVLVKSVVLLLIFVYAGCSSQISKIDSESSIEPFFSIQFSSIKDTANIYIEDLVDDFVILPLDDNKEALCAPLTVYITEQHIGMTPSERGGTYKLFSRDGRFLCNVGGFGQGPGEYTSLLYHQIDEKAKRVYLNTFNATKIMAYDFNGA